MDEQSLSIDLLHDYMQADAPLRIQQFQRFVQALKQLREGEQAKGAQDWARRAISPHLDYSSLMILRRFTHLEAELTGSESLLRLAILGGPGSELESFRPSVVFIAVGARDVARLPSVDDTEEIVGRMANEEIAD